MVMNDPVPPSPGAADRAAMWAGWRRGSPVGGTQAVWSSSVSDGVVLLTRVTSVRSSPQTPPGQPGCWAMLATTWRTWSSTLLTWATSGETPSGSNTWAGISSLLTLDFPCRAAPYDFRFAPHSQEAYFQRLRAMVEEMYER